MQQLIVAASYDDLTHANFMLEKDDVTPNPVMPELKKAYKMIRDYWAGREQR